MLVNAAGIPVLGPVEAVPEQQTRAQLEVNLFGTLVVTRAFLPPMRQRGDGRIVNVSSILGRFALPGSGLYAASRQLRVGRCPRLAAPDRPSTTQATGPSRATCSLR